MTMINNKIRFVNMIYCCYNYVRVPMRHATIQLLRKRTENIIERK